LNFSKSKKNIFFISSSPVIKIVTKWKHCFSKNIWWGE